MMDEFPSVQECAEAIKHMKNNKSPGLDGIPIEFYKIFWNKIKDYFYSCIIENYLKEEMSYPQKLSVISLIFKKGERGSLGNYRPISLTYCDYKIMTFVFACRLQRVMDKLINQHISKADI